MSNEQTEREIKMAAPLGFEMPSLSDGGDGLTAGPPEHMELESVYYDTPDLRLARHGVSLRHRNDEGWAVKMRRSTDGRGLLDRATYGFEGEPGEPPSAALDLVRGVLRTADLAPIAHLHTSRTSIDVRTGDGRPVAELTDDDVEVRDSGRLVDRFRELEIELADGVTAADADAIVQRLREAGARAPEPTPKIVRALGPRAEDPPDLAAPDVDKHSGVEDVLRAALAAAATKLVDHDAGIRARSDPEDIHQARVATRRLRSHLRTFRSLIDETWATDLRDDLKWLGELLGTVRDAEVLEDRLTELVDQLPHDDAAAATRLLDTLRRTRSEGRETLLEAMRSPRYLDLLERVVAAAQRPRLLLRVSDVDDRDVLLELARRPWKHLRKAVADLADDPPDEELHAVRIRAKRARYAVEAVTAVFGKPARQLAHALTDLQDVLGEHQDAVVAGQWLRETAATTGDEAVGFVAGQLAVLEREAADKSRARWPKAWRALDRKRNVGWL